MVDLLNASSCGIFSFDDEGNILQVNAAFCSLLESDKESLIHQKVNTVFTIPTMIFFQTHMYPLLKVGEHLEEIFITLKAKGGKQVPVILSAKRVVNDDHIENVCSCITVYNRKSYEDEIILAKNEAQRVLKENNTIKEAQEKLQEHIRLLDEKMFLLQQYNDTLKEISHAVTHELQEPLRKLTLFTDLLLSKNQSYFNDEDKRRITGQIDRVKEVLRGLQSYVWLEDSMPDKTSVDLNEVIQLVHKQTLINYEGLNYKLSFSRLPVIEGNFEQFIILFKELFSNAIKFRSAQRELHITIEATTIKRNQFKLLQDHYAYRAYHKIDFTDNGIGFDLKYLNYIFQLFKKLDNKVKGTGIGLALCKKVVLNHNGLLTASSKEGLGSTVTIFLPLND